MDPNIESEVQPQQQSQPQPQHELNQTLLLELLELVRSQQRLTQHAIQSEPAVTQLFAQALALSQPQLQTPTPNPNTTPTPPQHQTPATPQPHSNQTFQSVLQDLVQSLQSLKQDQAQLHLLLAKTPPQFPSPPHLQPKFPSPPHLQPQSQPQVDQTFQPLCRADLIGSHNTITESRIELISRIHCVESNEESFEKEYVSFLKCHVSEEVNHLQEGLKHGLKSKLEKVSPALGRSAMVLKESRINALPRFLNIQFARYFRNRESNMLDKILKKVDYPLELDVYDFCSDDLLKKMEAPRQILRNEESSVQKGNDVKMFDAEGSSSGGRGSFAVPMEGQKETKVNRIYELFAVLNYKNRHVGWLKLANGKWGEYDPDNSAKRHIPVDQTSLFEEDDWLMPDMVLYRTLPKY